MTARERWFRAAVRAYPQRYRTERGDEVLTTLLESTETASWASIAADGLDVVGHGVRMRAGVEAGRFGGRVLDLAALPGLMTAAAFAVFLFVWGDVLPVVDPVSPGFSPTSARFGPFLTVGPVICLAWVLGAVGSVVRPRWRRSLATVCVFATPLVFVVGKVAFASPNFFQMVVLVTLGVPAVLAPTAELPWRRAVGGLAVGAMLFAFAWRFVAPHPIQLPASRRYPAYQFYDTFYRYGAIDLGRHLPWLVGAVLVATAALLALRRPDVAGAVVVVGIPLLAEAAGYVRDAYFTFGYPVGHVAWCGIVLVALVLWLAVVWMLDARRSRLEELDPA